VDRTKAGVARDPVRSEALASHHYSYQHLHPTLVRSSVTF
jgi:hypothetical protein